METTATNKRLHVFLRHPMQLCRSAGLFPVEGLDKECITKLRFNIRSLYAFYHVVTLLSQMVLASLSISYFFKNDLKLDNLISILFYLTGLISALLLLKLAKNWPQLIRRASHIEDLVADIRDNTSKAWRQDRIAYGIANLQATFLWSITDAVTMCTSLYLASYFQDLNKLIERQEKQKLVNWKEIRVFYSYLVELVNAVDENMCYLILMSFFTNLCFICIQLYYLTKVFDSWEHTVYYAYSFLFLFIRASVTSLLAANINTLSQRPMMVLQNVSPLEYTVDVQRFIRQIRYTTTALSGLYFYITRGMIITVIGTVIKYELVMFQFSLNKV
ncbi:gustatory receptor 5a for trehalose-like [Nymphalis io]|uniref:gustatory receptor 5a for trehalose-like n=1 Tax=Inachis io TaxID=171585 RepID=UPI002169A149|nr:gustatory receptor 5a for trehalose-like [Nymphalis io]